MTRDEALVFKVFDKKADGPRFALHTAFEDPLTPAEGGTTAALDRGAHDCLRRPAAAYVSLKSGANI